MDIEITTTKKKLTKSIIMQMPQADKHTMRCGEVLGYVNGARKDSFTVGLIRRDDEHYWFAMNWKCSDDSVSVYRKTSGQWGTSKKFKTEQIKNEWWKYYEIARDTAKNTHIYI